MASEALKNRKGRVPDVINRIREEIADLDSHPAGEAKHGNAVQLLRSILFAAYFLSCATTIFVTQILGSPLYFINRNLYYAYMALTKQSFALQITTMTKWWSPTLIRVSGDESVSGQIKKTADGRVECMFPERLVMIANHQLYLDWLYLWWIAYTNRMHGHIFIILRESLKYLPIIGQGMMFYGFVFMSRKFETDKPRLAHRLQQLKSRHSGPMSGSSGLDPMWLMIFPEGTNLSDNGRAKSAKWAEKQGIADMQHQLLPRSTGSFYCLNELKGTVDWIYDCTMAYEGVPRGKFGQDFFTLRSAYFEGRPPKSVNLHWRRFAISTVPLDSQPEFDAWLMARWREKDELMETYVQTGCFPSTGVFDDESQTGAKGVKPTTSIIETEVKPRHWWEVGQIFVVLAAFSLAANIAAKAYNVAVYGDMHGWKGA